MPTQEEMIEIQLKNRGISNPAVLEAMHKVDRAQFVPDDLKPQAYEDRPLPIGKEQTISQPYIVAFMAQKLDPDPEDRILEVGTGCGYNAAVLSQLAQHVYSIEIIEWLADLAKQNLAPSGIQNISTHQGDGYQGWPEQAPFDGIILTAAPPEIPSPLKEQLKIGGRLLAPVGRKGQKLVLLEKTGPESFKQKDLLLVNFVPMTGEAQQSG